MIIRNRCMGKIKCTKYIMTQKRINYGKNVKFGNPKWCPGSDLDYVRPRGKHYSGGKGFLSIHRNFFELY